MLRAGLLGLLLAVGCVPTEREERPGEAPAPGTPGEAPAPGTPGTDGQRGTDGFQGMNRPEGTDDVQGERGTTPAMPPASTPGTPGTPGTEPGTAQTETRTGQAPAASAESTRQALTDLHQAHVHELALAKVAAEKSKDPGVLSFAEEETRVHTRADGDLVELAKKEDITWETADPNRYNEQAATVERLRGLDGVAFDQAYIQETGQGHDKTLTLVESSLTTIQDPEIRSYLEQVRPILQSHRDRARQLRPGEQG